MKSTFSVIYYLKRQVVKKDGTVPVMGRITVDGSQTQFSCKLTIDPKLWDTKGGRVTGRSTAALETNRMLDKMRVRINKHADAGVPATQRGLCQAGGSRHESQRHTLEVQDRLQAPARVSQHPLPREGHRVERAYPRFHFRLRDVSAHGQTLLHQYRVAVCMPTSDDGVHRHQQRMAHTRPVQGV